MRPTGQERAKPRLITGPLTGVGSAQPRLRTVHQHGSPAARAGRGDGRRPADPARCPQAAGAAGDARARRPDATVSVERWSRACGASEPPASAPKMVQLYVSQLRRLLDGDGAEIVTRGRGYELRLAATRSTPARFERLVEEAARTAAAAREALALWRGDAARRRRRRAVRGRRDPAARGAARCAQPSWRSTPTSRPAATREVDRRARRARRGESAARAPARPADARALPRRPPGGGARGVPRRARAELVEQIGVEPGAELQRLHERSCARTRALDRSPRTPRPPRAGRRRREAARPRRTRWRVLRRRARGRRRRRGVRRHPPARRPTACQASTRTPSASSIRAAAITAPVSRRARLRTPWSPAAARCGSPAGWRGAVARIDRGDGRVGRRSRSAAPRRAGLRRGMRCGSPTATAAGRAGRPRARTRSSGRSIEVGNAPRVAGGRGRRAVGRLRRRRSSVAPDRSARGRREPQDLPRPGPRRSRPARERSGSRARRPAPSPASSRARGRGRRAVNVGNGPSAVAVGEGAVWTVNRDDGTLSRDRARARTPWPGPCTSAATPSRSRSAMARSGWRAGPTGTVTRVDPAAGACPRARPGGSSPAGLAVGRGPALVARGRDRVRPPRRDAAASSTRTTGPTPIRNWLNERTRPRDRECSSLAYDGLVAYRRADGRRRDEG